MSIGAVMGQTCKMARNSEYWATAKPLKYLQKISRAGVAESADAQDLKLSAAVHPVRPSAIKSTLSFFSNHYKTQLNAYLLLSIGAVMGQGLGLSNVGHGHIKGGLTLNPYTGEIKPEHLLTEEEKKVFVPVPDQVIHRAHELNRHERRKSMALARKKS